MTSRSTSGGLRRLAGFVRSQDGQTATEYAVLLALIIVVAMATIAKTGQNILWVYQQIHTAFGALG